MKLANEPSKTNLFKLPTLPTYKMTLLTKSKDLVGLQCPRCLWVVFNEKERIPESDAIQHNK